MPLARVSAPTRLRSAWAGRPRPHSSPNSARHVPCLSFSLLERGAPNPEAQLRPTRCPEAERAHPAGTPAPQSRVTAPYLRSGPRRPPPGRPGDPRPARVPPVPPASRRWAALRARGPRWRASARRVGKWGGGWRAGRRPPPPAPARRLPLQLLPLARARVRAWGGAGGPTACLRILKVCFALWLISGRQREGKCGGGTGVQRRGGLPGGSPRAPPRCVIREVTKGWMEEMEAMRGTRLYKVRRKRGEGRPHWERDGWEYSKVK